MGGNSPADDKGRCPNERGAGVMISGWNSITRVAKYEIQRIFYRFDRAAANAVKIIAITSKERYEAPGSGKYRQIKLLIG
jgi:hypothetical protein